MLNVKSKYKNPDKYIRELKNEVETAWEVSREHYSLYEEEFGKNVFNYAENSFLKFYLISRMFGDLKVRQRISIIGTVEEVSESIACYKNGENRSDIKLRLIEVRKYI